MNKDNPQNQNDENEAYEKKHISNKPHHESKETTEITQSVNDDEYLKSALAAEIPLETASIRKASRINGDRRSKPSGLTEKEYFDTFFKIPKQNASKGRSVYIRPEFHQKFLKLIAGLEIDRLTIYAYLDNIIEYHFTEFEQMIYKIYEERNKPLF